MKTPREPAHRSGAIYLTGLPGSGKTTLACALGRRLAGRGVQACILDGDEFRKTYCRDLGYSREDRRENLRRITAAAFRLVSAGNIAVVAAIAPFRDDRDEARRAFDGGAFLEIFVDAPFHVCRNRDPKSLYRAAFTGSVPQMTGVDSPYERPQFPDLTLPTDKMTVEACVDSLMSFLASAGWFCESGR